MKPGLARHCSSAHLCQRGRSKSVKSSTCRSSDARPAGPMPPCRQSTRMPAEQQGCLGRLKAAQPAHRACCNLDDHHAAHGGCSVRGPGRGRLALRHHLLPLAAAHVHDVHVVGRPASRMPAARTEDRASLCVSMRCRARAAPLHLPSRCDQAGGASPVPVGGPGEAGGPSDR